MLPIILPSSPFMHRTYYYCISIYVADTIMPIGKDIRILTLVSMRLQGAMLWSIVGY